MSDLKPSRRHLLGVGASAAMMASQGSGPVLAETTGSIPSRSGLAWASGVRAVDPDAFVALRQRPIDVLVTYSKKETWAEIRGSGNYNYKSLLGPRQNRQEVIVVSYPLFPVEQNPRDHGADLWRRAANGEFDMHHDAAAATFAPYPQTLIFRPGWEWNVAGFAPWSCTDVALAADYVTYFRRVVDRLRAHRPNCRIDWCSGKKGRTNASIDEIPVRTGPTLLAMTSMTGGFPLETKPNGILTTTHFGKAVHAASGHGSPMQDPRERS